MNISFLEAINTANSLTTMQSIGDKLLDMCVSAGKSILVAALIFLIGRYVIKFLNHMLARMLDRSKVDPAVQSFLKSLVNILLIILLIVTIIGALGIETTSFAALIASAGVAIGMALSGQLQNFAGGLVILLLKPYKVGDLIETQNTMGVVKEIQIFHTILCQPDNRIIYIPNASMTSSVIINHTRLETRRLTWDVSISYGEDVERVKKVVLDILAKHPLVLQEIEPTVELSQLADSSVVLQIRAWAKTDDYWRVNFDINRLIYDRFNAEKIEFPFPQTTVHMAEA